MKEVGKRDIVRLIIDQKEIEYQVKVPYDEDLIDDENQPRSPCLTALSNKKGLLIYGLRQKLVIVNQKGLMKLCNQAKGIGSSEDIERPTLESMQKNKEAVTISFPKADVGTDQIQRILLEEDYDSNGSLIIVGFSTKVFILDLNSIILGEYCFKTKYELPKETLLKSICLINGTTLILNNQGHVAAVGGSLKTGDLNSVPILDSNPYLFSFLYRSC
jgi:hypothetical protein